MGGAVRAGGAFLLQLLGTEAPFNGESLVRLSWGRGRAVACHPLGAQAGSAVLECRASHRPWGPRVDTRPMVLIYRFRPFRAHSSAAVGMLTSSRRHRRAVQGHGAPLPNNPTTPCTEQPLPAPPAPEGRSLASSLGFARSGCVCRRDHGPCGFRVRLLSPSGTFPGFSVSACVSVCQRVSARVRPCPRLRGPSRVPLPGVGLACVRRSRPEGLRGSTVLAPCRTMQSCVLVPEHGRVLHADPSHAATRVWECLSHLTEPKGVFEPASTGV